MQLPAHLTECIADWAFPRTLITWVVVGPPGSGKSTLAGRLVELRGHGCSVETQRDLDSGVGGAEKIGLHTATQCRSRWRLHTIKSDGILVDTPGDRSDVTELISETVHADVVVLVVPAATQHSHALLWQQLLVAHGLGIDKFVVAVNGMDTVPDPWSQKSFVQAKDDVLSVFNSVGYVDTDSFQFIPTCGLLGQNLTIPSTRMSWYQGPTVIAALDETPAPQSQLDKPLRVSIHHSFVSCPELSTVTGLIEAGSISYGQLVTFQPGNHTCTVKEIKLRNKRNVRSADTGDEVTFSVDIPSNLNLLRKGMICGDAIKNPPRQSKAFTVALQVLSQSTVWNGYTTVAETHNARVACRCQIQEANEPW
ncbi:Elongation factor 1-alpha [Pelomyxa schiedti]|nr:Elongation factor 1-alpha [Pelomyxa schiedti]